MKQTTDAPAEAQYETEVAANDVKRLVDSAKVSSKTGAWFVIRCDESDVESVAQKIITDSTVNLYKVEAAEGFVSATHVDYTHD